MTYREMVQHEQDIRPAFRIAGEKSWWQTTWENNSPVMLMWFFLMALQWLGFILII